MVVDLNIKQIQRGSTQSIYITDECCLVRDNFLHYKPALIYGK
jgi:hypothetical protein